MAENAVVVATTAASGLLSCYAAVAAVTSWAASVGDVAASQFPVHKKFSRSEVSPAEFFGGAGGIVFV